MAQSRGQAMPTMIDADLGHLCALHHGDAHRELLAAGYKQLLGVERGWRDMKSVLELRPVYHRLGQRIRAHVLPCWLALLFIRIAGNATGKAWPVIRRELERIHLGTFTGPAGTFRQRTELSKLPGTC
jgi:hypothetical protein